MSQESFDFKADDFASFPPAVGRCVSHWIGKGKSRSQAIAACIAIESPGMSKSKLAKMARLAEFGLSQDDAEILAEASAFCELGYIDEDGLHANIREVAATDDDVPKLFSLLRGDEETPRDFKLRETPEWEENEDGTLNIRGVEVFNEGDHNGENYTAKDMELLEVGTNTARKDLGYKPGVAPGHEWEKKFEGAAPKLGIVEKLRRMGKSVIADLVRIPRDFAEAIQRGNWDKPSAEIIFNWKHPKTGRRYHLLKAFRFLSLDLPGVRDIEGLAKLYEGVTDEAASVLMPESLEGLKAFSFDEAPTNGGGDKGGDSNMAEIEQKELDRLRALDEKSKDFETKEREFAERRKADKQRKIEVAFDRLVQDGKKTMAEKESFVAFCMDLDDEKTREFSVGSSKQTMSPLEFHLRNELGKDPTVDLEPLSVSNDSESPENPKAKVSKFAWEDKEKREKEPETAFMALIRHTQRDEKLKTFAEAFDRAIVLDPELAEAYNEAEVKRCKGSSGYTPGQLNRVIVG